MLSRVLVGLFAVALVAAVAPAMAGDCCAPPVPACAVPACAPTCGPTCCEKTILVPRICMEPRTIRRCCMRPEVRQQTVTVMRSVPETVAVQRQCTVMVPEVRSRVEDCTCQQSRTVNYTVCVPQVQTRTEYVTTCRLVPEQRVRQCTVLVPYEVAETIQVPVLRMVPKTIHVAARPAPCCQSCSYSPWPTAVTASLR